MKAHLHSPCMLVFVVLALLVMSSVAVSVNVAPTTDGGDKPNVRPLSSLLGQLEVRNDALFEQMKLSTDDLAKGWSTWRFTSVLSFVLLPQAFGVNIGMKEFRNGKSVNEAVISREKDEDSSPIFRPIAHSFDRSYIEYSMLYADVNYTVQASALPTTDGGASIPEFVILVTPNAIQKKQPVLIVSGELLYARRGLFGRPSDHVLQATFTDGSSISVHATQSSMECEPTTDISTPYLSFMMQVGTPIGVSIGTKRTLSAIQTIITQQKSAWLKRLKQYDDLANAYAGIEAALAFNTVYEPLHGVIAPVSRNWFWDEAVIFEWDTYLSAYMATVSDASTPLAKANALSVTSQLTESGFVPNFSTGPYVKSRDRSQPPVGSIVVREIYRKTKDTKFLKAVYTNLLTWNRWWWTKRQYNGLLTWGSNPYTPVADQVFEVNDVNDLTGSKFESGLDNSPLYDNATFDNNTHQMLMWDVGLNALYAADCASLADIATTLGDAASAAELLKRGGVVAANINSRLWDETSGIYLNFDLHLNASVGHVAPTNMYPLLLGPDIVSSTRASRIVKSYLLNESRFWGTYPLPSISRDNPAFADQNYWRGRIWGPLNLIVYLGLSRYDQADVAAARKEFARRSRLLFEKEWTALGHVHENYSPTTGQGCDSDWSDPFYHWGALLAFTDFIEHGVVPRPMQPLSRQ